jgi:hypothetical protein
MGEDSNQVAVLLKRSRRKRAGLPEHPVAKIRIRYLTYQVPNTCLRWEPGRFGSSVMRATYLVLE